MIQSHHIAAQFARERHADLVRAARSQRAPREAEEAVSRPADSALQRTPEAPASGVPRSGGAHVAVGVGCNS
jgi:hypothetical protein